MEKRVKTLMRYSKKKLAEHCYCLEHNNSVLKERFEIQYKNCMQMVSEMNIFN